MLLNTLPCSGSPPPIIKDYSVQRVSSAEGEKPWAKSKPAMENSGLLWLPRRKGSGGGLDWIGSLGLADANYYT